MLEYDRIDISEGIDANKCKDTSKKCSLCKFYYFLHKNLNMDHIYVMVVMIYLSKQ